MRFALFAFYFFCAVKANSKTLNDVLSLVQQNHNVLGNIKLEKFDEKLRSKIKTYNLNFIKEDEKFSLEINTPVPKSQFLKLSKNSLAIIHKNYKEEPAPYQGEMTTSFKCPNEFLPVDFTEKLNGNSVFGLRYYSAENYSYRICDKKLVTYTTCNSFYYDEKNKSSYQLKISVKPDGDCLTSTVKFFKDFNNIN